MCKYVCTSMCVCVCVCFWAHVTSHAPLSAPLCELAKEENDGEWRGCQDSFVRRGLEIQGVFCYCFLCTVTRDASVLSSYEERSCTVNRKLVERVKLKPVGGNALVKSESGLRGSSCTHRRFSRFATRDRSRDKSYHRDTESTIVGRERFPHEHAQKQFYYLYFNRTYL